ncbi:DHA2 family efflux MFS transporter permease subunit [Allokutzneria sp. A3M-2-11 16]|uniref:DHA2 family efflux MFS transporter permease subunit n=1 Tax=Allokutzneria sp. A3M-2-11 16 TaxID=2962043 RepID=UPI0020B7A6AE|nr:DHA2 family efflux MFS transporter permease subunit [Allokutzneria sp. A3M-2-11 16]MCP3802837.1 DHA2 family efflux MFS transporter permease subunit [Allokutzneria sp. A3M-2-11 16]
MALAVILVAAFMDLIDVTILNVVLPAIEADLGATPAQLQWMVGGYALALAVGLITGARLGDLLGHRRVFVAGLAGFALASALCGLAGSAGALIGARVLQGLLAAVMIPQVLTQIQLMYPPRRRAAPMAAFTALSGLAATLGPILGPALLAWDLGGLGWRLVFWVNVPIGLFAAVAARRLLPKDRPGAARRLDLAGLVLSATGLFLVLYPLNHNGHWELLAAGAVVLAVFVVHERRVADPLVDLSLLRVRSVSGGLLLQLLFFVPTMGFFLVYMLHLQNAAGFGPTRAGLMMLPWSVAVPVFAGLAVAVLMPRIGRVTVQIGLIVLAAGFAVIAAHPEAVWGPIVGGAGMGLIIAPLAQLTLGEVPETAAGSASGLYNTVAQLAASLGVAIIGSHYASTSSLASSLWLGVALLAVAFAATFLLPRRAPAREVIHA